MKAAVHHCLPHHCIRQGHRWFSRPFKRPLRPRLDAYLFTSIHMCWSKMKWNLV